MYITCHECNTVFRLDERRLKSAGSKVRCSQCGNIFTAFPPLPGMDAEPSVLAADAGPAVSAAASSALAGPTAAEAAPTQKQLEGIDMAALDAILDTKRDGGQKHSEAHIEPADGDLDLDFDMDLDTAGPNLQASGQSPDSTSETFDDVDLEMDFEIDDGLDGPDQRSIEPTGSTGSRDALADDLAA
ncbi:MAG: hypothetical protein EHM48_04550, partial [Planctomycetaceae bacterium]